jgi:hypothetical protein
MERNHIHMQRVRFVLLLGVVLAINPVVRAVEYAGGTGEPNDPYLIATAEQLRGADFNVPGTYFRLSSSIDLDRKEWWVSSFRAHLDGAGFAIQNGVLADAGPGFIGTLESEGTIANLTLRGFDIGTSQGYYVMGSLVLDNRGVIMNCGAVGWIAAYESPQVGGLVGYNRGSIINCYFDGWVITRWEAKTEEDERMSQVGGLVAYNGEGGLIVNSFARGCVIGPAGLGGLAGINEGRIMDSYATCAVVGGVGSGGLVARNYGSLRNCYASGWVDGPMRGGLVGMAGRYAGSAVNCRWYTKATNCLRSGAGMALAYPDSALTDLALNGWAGDPNWVMMKGEGLSDNYPRLAWEGTPGEMVPEYPLPIFLWGSGTESDPYLIRNQWELACLCAYSVYWDRHFVLANDIDIGFTPEFSPIGVCAGSSFSGTFDGQGHRIRNLSTDTIDNGEATTWNWGLFGYVTGEVRNLVLENFRLTGGVNCCRVGLLAGTSEGVITNCSATGSIAVGEDSQFIGGLIGYNYGKVSDCEATVGIEAGAGSTDIGALTGADHPPL